MPLLPFAALDPRRLDNPITGGINTVTGQNLKTLLQTQATSPNVPPGVNNGVNNGVPDTGADPYVSNGQSTVAPMDAGTGAADDGTTTDIQDEINRQNAKAQSSSTSGKVESFKGNFSSNPLS